MFGSGEVSPLREIPGQLHREMSRCCIYTASERYTRDSSLVFLFLLLFEYYLTTRDMNRPENKTIETGDWRLKVDTTDGFIYTLCSDI